MNNSHEWLGSIRPEVGNYIAGFVDGEGSFNVSLKKRDDHRAGWQIEPSFNVSQRDRVILAFLKTTFGCGTLRTRPDGVVYYEVRNVTMLKEKILPFFDRFQFRSAAKKRNFSIFKRIVRLLYESTDTKAVLTQVVLLREQLNEGRGRKRKYEAHHVLR
jgi:hypothetical protein